MPRSEKVPHIADQYDNGSFLDYPIRSRFKPVYDLFVTDGDEAHYDKGRLQDSAMQAELNALMQTWLFFGLLHEVFGDRAPASAFLTQDTETSQTLVTTINLPGIAQEWIPQHTDRDESERHELLEHLVICTQRTNDFMKQVRRQLDKTSSCNMIMVTIAALGETMESIVLETLHKGTRSMPTTWASFYDSEDLVATMLHNNWCPADVAAWRNPEGSEIQMLYYLSKVVQPQVKNHSHCDGAQCVASQYNMAQTELLHRCADRSCGDFYVDDVKVMDALADGYIALLDISCEDDTQDLRIDVVSSKDGQAYIVLSHVWADGLGNPFANALPGCQLAYVARIVQSMRDKAPSEEGKLLLWLDTLCCPVRSDDHRAMCLERMTNIYKAAAYVLVLDGPLEHFSLDDLDAIEICMRLKYSGWMRRLWTLQEGVHANRLWLQLKDESVNLDLVEEYLSGIYKTDTIHESIVLPLIAYMRELRGLINRRAANRGPAGLAEVIRAFKQRSVSVATDEPLCLANCLDIDQRVIVRVRPEDRMKTFWRVLPDVRDSDSEVRGIPRGIIFFREARLSEPGYRWAPASVMHKHEFGNLRKPKIVGDLARITPQGLVAKYPACEVTVPCQLEEADKVRWNELLKSAPAALFIRYHEKKWFCMTWNAAPGRHVEPDSIMKHMQADGGTKIFIAEPALDEMLSDEANRNAAQLMTGTIVSGDSDKIHFRSEKYATMGSLPKNLVIQLEAVWQIAQDPELRSLLSPSRKDPDEGPLYPELPQDEGLRQLPNDGAQRLFDLADEALQDEELARSYGTATRQMMRENLAGLTMFMVSERWGQIGRTWTGEQVWCVD